MCLWNGEQLCCEFCSRGVLDRKGVLRLFPLNLCDSKPSLKVRRKAKVGFVSRRPFHDQSIDLQISQSTALRQLREGGSHPLALDSLVSTVNPRRRRKARVHWFRESKKKKKKTKRETSVRLIFPPLESFFITTLREKKGGCESTKMTTRGTSQTQSDIQTKIIVNKALPHTGPTKVEESDNGEEKRKGTKQARANTEGIQSRDPAIHFDTKDEANTFPAFIESACTSACVECVYASDWATARVQATRFYSANNVFVYSARVLENRRNHGSCVCTSVSR